MNTFLQSVQNLDGEILLQIQQHLRTDMLTPFMKIVKMCIRDRLWFMLLMGLILIFIPSSMFRSISQMNLNLPSAVIQAVSYTHLDVYKRQAQAGRSFWIDRLTCPSV